MKALPVATVLLIAAAGGAGYWYLDQRAPAAKPDTYQGYVDGDLLQVGPEISGHIILLSVDEGSRVRAGELVIKLDDTMQQAQVELAAARLEEARARLRLAQAQRRRPEEIRVLEAAVKQAEAALEVSKSEYERVRKLYEQRVVPKARLDVARGALDRDKARLEEARRQLETARLPARAEEINAAWASVRAAEAQLQEARTQLLHTRVEAPASGMVQEVFFRPGEIVRAGQPVLSILPPGNLRIRFYVPEPERPRFRQGDTVSVSCDGCPEGMKARITFISRTVEYTPPVIFSPRERAKLVFRMEAKPLNDGTKLGLGQPVDVRPLVGKGK